jgi:hypothetical protein
MFIKTMHKEIQRAWRSSPPLAATAALMLAALVLSLIGLGVDSRIITGSPAWLKPIKFAISTAIFAGTMAWLFRYITVWPRFMKVLGWVLAVSLVVEVGIIDLQAARGTTSHFNVGTTLDAALFSVMGTFIMLLLLSSTMILAALFRQKFSDPDWGWALRLGMLITALGSGTGGLMLRPQPGQITGGSVPQQTVGAHTVGGPDGGAGLAGVGWSSHHGDLRVPHFLGLHGIQLVPLASFLIARRRSFTLRQRVRLTILVAASYFGLVCILLWQALRGQSIAEPNGTTLAAFAMWLIVTGAGYLVIAAKKFLRVNGAAAGASVSLFL